MNVPRQSRWRDDGEWNHRLQRDRQLIGERLDDDQKQVLEAVPRLVNDLWPVEFVLVVGSRATGRHRKDSDLDLYLEADGAPQDARDAPVVPNEHFNVLIVPSGAILGNVRAGESYATGFARDGLIAQDNGAYRRAIVELEEEGLLD